ncbi:MAG TPA: bifunctional (p)ppGpp synthetase/guanosine-3',5'-bis(diphosphate) 3'-pyrophosphohydrolase [Candidatus Binatia bacterium]|nr:bifunctional (p)ppGpp synthetase/guanosine-3',5'-bis(diphosphate) 3'-pyrophosphohydrolase [Candidatus Binatia bacterium]
MELPVIQRIGAALRTRSVAREFGIDALTVLLEEYLPAPQIGEVRRAHEFGARLHEGQLRTSGEPYIYHPLAVARILAQMRLDHVTLMAAILHDTIEDTTTSKEELERQFGPDVAELVDGVSKFQKIEGRTRAEVQAESFRKLLMAMTQDLRVILIKLADRLHNMRTLEHREPAKRRRTARETLEIYAPIAQRLGIHFIRTELEDLAFAHLYPHRNLVLERAIREQLGDTKATIKEIEERLNQELRDEGIGASVVGRQKNLYSIYQKMRRRRLKFPDVMDLLGFRIIVTKVDECYRALGVVHHVYKPVSELFNDYIANPKVNGYQSLHTTCVGPKGRKIEVQIRSRDMHHIAESGIAAHWQYKLGDRAGAQHTAPQVRAREWLGQLFEMQGGAPAIDFVENVKVDLFPDEVYVFTPKGDIRRLPRGATPVDLAYAVHTDLGNHCVASRVDQQLEPLTSPLKNGQTVEIITARHARPNAAWLNFVKTAKARHCIRNELKNQRHDEAIRLGRRLLEKSMRELKIPPAKLREENVAAVLKTYELPHLEDLFLSIGLGQRLAPLVARHFIPSSDAAAAPGETLPFAVEGTEGLVVDYARCCRPVPGDDIRGHVSVGRGIVIHRSECRVAQPRKGTQQDWIPLVWADTVQGIYMAELRIKGQNERGVLAKIATEISSAESSIEHVTMSERVANEAADMRFVITVRDRTHLARVMRRIRALPVVARVVRVGGVAT